MYPRTITEKIVEYWALGFSAEETRQALLDKQDIAIHVNTIYKHRHGLTAQNLIDELVRRQERAILKADTDNPPLAMKYRNELLKILVPQRIESRSLIMEKVTIDANVNASLAEYERILEEAARLNLQANNPEQPVDTSQTPPKTTTIPSPQ